MNHERARLIEKMKHAMQQASEQGYTKPTPSAKPIRLDELRLTPMFSDAYTDTGAKPVKVKPASKQK